MKLVIDIPKRMYLYAKKDMLCGADVLVSAIKNGIPLPKGHGKIVDVGTIDLNQDEFISQSDYYAAECAIENAPTIIEADTAGK